MAYVFEMVASMNLLSSTPREVVDTLRYMTRDSDYDFATSLQGPLFTDAEEHWSSMLQYRENAVCEVIPGPFYARFSASYPNRDTSTSGWSLGFRAFNIEHMLKYYIALLELILPLCETRGFIGYYRWDNELDPHIMYFDGDKLYAHQMETVPTELRSGLTDSGAEPIA